jgi:hypothetical protein
VFRIGIAFASVGFPEVLIETNHLLVEFYQMRFCPTKSLITGNALALKVQ